MAESRRATSSSDSFGTPGSPPSTSSDDTTESTTLNIVQDDCNKPKRRRTNTVSEKRVMRRERKKRRRRMKKLVLAQQEKSQQQHGSEQKELERDVILYKQMAQDYWDRWQWEKNKRKEEMGRKQTTSKSLHQIDPSQLSDPIQGSKQTKVYLGRGSFSIVQLKVYRGMYVAVKQFRTQSLKADVHNEAFFLSSLCHPHLPYLFGVCTASPPYRIVTQFHGIDYKTVTLQREIHQHRLITSRVHWIILCSQLLEAVSYLHCEAQLLHNDIKEDNILLSQNSQQLNTSPIASSSSYSSEYHIVLTDFGKATHVSRGRHYNLSEREKEQYLANFPHFAPEVVNGNEKQTVMSDMYAVGMLFKKMCDHGCFGSFPERSLLEVIGKCKSAEISQQPTATQCTELIKKLI